MGPDSKQTTASQELKYASAGLKRETGWWGAFVIGLAGTILVTGIAPVMVTTLGASSIPITSVRGSTFRKTSAASATLSERIPRPEWETMPLSA